MIDDEWTNAIGAVIASSRPDTKPLAMWLRSEKPIPSGIRQSIAELLDPGEPPLYNVRLVPKLIRTANKEAEFLLKFTAVGIYNMCRAKGMSEKDAGVEASKIFSREKSGFHKNRKLINRLVPELLKRIRHGLNFGGRNFQKIATDFAENLIIKKAVRIYPRMADDHRIGPTFRGWLTAWTKPLKSVAYRDRLYSCTFKKADLRAFGLAAADLSMLANSGASAGRHLAAAVVCGVHITRLALGGDKAAVEPVKIMLGHSMGLPIVLAPANDLLAKSVRRHPAADRGTAPAA